MLNISMLGNQCSYSEGGKISHLKAWGEGGREFYRFKLTGATVLTKNPRKQRDKYVPRVREEIFSGFTVISQNSFILYWLCCQKCQYIRIDACIIRFLDRITSVRLISMCYIWLPFEVPCLTFLISASSINKRVYYMLCSICICSCILSPLC